MVTRSSASSASMAARASCRSLRSQPRRRLRTAPRPDRGTGPGAGTAVSRGAPAARGAGAVRGAARRRLSGVAKRSRRSARLARRLRSGRCASSSAAQQPLAAFDRTAAARSNRPQRQPLAVVADQPRPEPGAQKRRLAGARCAENHQETRRLAGCKPAQRVDAAHDIGAASEEDGGILRLERFEPAIGRAPAEGRSGIAAAARRCRAPMPAFSRPRLRLLRPSLRDGDGRLPLRAADGS